MSSANVPRQRSRGTLWGVVLALVVGALCYLVLIALTGVTFIAVLMAVLAMVVIGGLHYLVWGRAMAESVPAARLQMPPPASAERPADNFNLAIDDEERAALLRLLTQLEVQRREGVPLSPQDEALVRRVRDKLQTYGA